MTGINPYLLAARMITADVMHHLSLSGTGGSLNDVVAYVAGHVSNHGRQRPLLT